MAKAATTGKDSLVPVVDKATIPRWQDDPRAYQREYSRLYRAAQREKTLHQPNAGALREQCDRCGQKGE